MELNRWTVDLRTLRAVNDFFTFLITTVKSKSFKYQSIGNIREQWLAFIYTCTYMYVAIALESSVCVL